jgi:hypothetical protein
VKYNKVIILTINKFDQRDFFRFGVEGFLRNGIKVDIYDLTPFLRSPHYLKTYNPPEEIKEDYVFKIGNLLHLENLLKSNSNSTTFIICYLTLYQKTEKIFQILSALNFRYGVYRTTLPNLRPFFLEIMSRLRFIIKYNLLLRKIKPATIVLYAGRKTRWLNSSKISCNTIKIDVGNTDYNKYNEILQNGVTGQCTPDIVFIDEYYPLHPDRENELYIDPVFYYQSINVFLCKLTEQYNMSCGIAVHPRADYIEKNPFEFKLYFKQTAELVYNSKIVVGHASTAFNFAILGNKPIIQVGFRQLSNHFYGKVLTSFSNQLGIKTCFLDDLYTIPNLTINKRKYLKYIRNYIIADQKIETTDANAAFLSYVLNDINS